MFTSIERRALATLSNSFADCVVAPGETSGFDIISQDGLEQHVEIENNSVSVINAFGQQVEVRL